jgi:hypothetical protein
MLDDLISIKIELIKRADYYAMKCTDLDNQYFLLVSIALTEVALTIEDVIMKHSKVPN